jgi:hypothetical protein
VTIPHAAPNGPREPSAQLRTAAAQMRDLFIALTNEGFTEIQALRILGSMLSGQRPESS